MTQKLSFALDTVMYRQYDSATEQKCTLLYVLSCQVTVQ